MSAAYKQDLAVSSDRFSGSRRLFNELVAEASSARALGAGHEEVEASIGSNGKKLLRQLFQDHLDLRHVREARVWSFCAGAACTPGETYACEGADIVQCTQGVRMKAPCPLGTTCGASTGSGVLACNGTGPACGDDGSRCDGTRRIACLRDGFGKGREATVDCQPFGLACAATGSGP